MVRFIRARRTTTASSTSDTDKLRDQFIRQLTRDAENALRQMSQQFNQDLERQSSDFLGSLLGNGEGGSGGGSAFGLFTSAGRYLFNRPRTKESTQESTRSRDEDSRFRLSQSQMMAEASASIAKGEKNL